MLFKLWQQNMSGRWFALLLVMLAQVLDCVMSLWLPTLNAEIINRGVVPGDVPFIWHLGGLMLIVSILQIVGTVVTAFFAGRVAMWVGRDLRQKVYDKVLTFDSSQMRHFSSGSLITRATNDVNQVQGVIFMTFLFLVQAPILGLGALFMSITLDAPLSLLFLVIIPVMAAVMGLMMRAMSPLFQQQQTRIDEVAARIRTSVTGARIVRAFGRKDFMNARFDLSNRGLRAVALRIGNLFALLMPSMQFIVAASSVAVVWFGGVRYHSGGMEIGDIVAFLTYLMQILMSVVMVAMIFLAVPRAEVCAKRLAEVLHSESQVSTPVRPKPFPNAPFYLDFRDVSLSFPGAERPLLDGINLEIRPGTTTAIIGPTGSGKTTLLRLLSRNLDPSGGSICVNGTDLRELDLERWRGLFSVVPQTSYLFSGTIATTVSGVDEGHITEEIRHRVTAALQSAQASEFVSRLEGGLDSTVKAGGSNFSGGQRQRLSVARALYRQTPILVLDDPFSALDFTTEALLRENLRKLSRELTVVLVAQRVASVRHADQILVVESGRVAGLGPHSELLKSCETYREIVESQLSLEEVI